MRKFEAVAVILGAIAICTLAKAADPTLPSGVAPGLQTSVTANIPTTSTVITLTTDCTHLTFGTTAGSSGVYFDPSAGTCTTSKYLIEGGGARQTYTGAPIRKFTVLGSDAGGTHGKMSYWGW